MSFDVSAVLCKFFPFILLSSSLYAEEVILVTADRIKSEVNKTSNDVTIFSQKEIRESSSKTLTELLSHQSDLYVASSGQENSSASVFIRGTDSSHTLVVIDGIIMNDPGNPNRQFDIGKLSLNNVEKVEILKGSQGLAYGSNAIGGVIVITTKKARSEELHGEHYYNLGSFKTTNAGANFQKRFGKLSSSFGMDFFRTDGFSAANEKSNPGAEKDGSQRATLDFNSTYDLSEEYDASVSLRYNHSDADLDKGGGPGSDDPNDSLVEEELYSRIQLKKTWESGSAETKLGFNHTSHHKKFDVLYDSQNPTMSTAISKGKLNDLNLEHTYFINPELTQNINLSYQHEDDQIGHSNENISAFLYHQLELARYIFNFGVRMDHNQIFNDHFTYKAAAGAKIENGLVKLSYSTGFRAPSLNQLFTPFYGNKNLVPETSKSIDLALDKNWTETFKTSSALFHTKIDDRFSYVPITFVNINRGSAEISGFEQSMAKRWSQQLAHTLAFTLLKTRDLSRGEKLARRPDINARNNIDFSVSEKHNFNYEISFTGQRLDVDNNGNTVKANSYLLSNVMYKYNMNNQGEFFFKVKNLFNKNYEEIYGFGTGGRALSIGARFLF